MKDVTAGRASGGTDRSMLAWSVVRPGPIRNGPLRRVQRPIPDPGAGELRIKVTSCGVCRTDLHVVEGDLPIHRAGVVPGHEVVGRVEALGPQTSRFRVGERVGIAWLRATCGRCRFCTSGRENLCLDPRFTGWDEDGGYADYAVAPEDYVYRLPDAFDDAHAAPLLCAGIIGYRALERTGLGDTGRLGIYGFGGSAHLTVQVALGRGLEVHVVTRSARARELALSLGAVSASEPHSPPPVAFDAAILFAPSGEIVPEALAALDRGGRLVVSGIHLSPIPPLDYDAHLFQERELVSVTANTRGDGVRFLEEAAGIPVQPTVTTFDLGHADRALLALARGEVRGAGVLLAPP